MFRALPRIAQVSRNLKVLSSTPTQSFHFILKPSAMSGLFEDGTPSEVKNAKGLHLITQNTPNGQKVQIMLEELKEVYGTEWTMTKMYTFLFSYH